MQRSYPFRDGVGLPVLLKNTRLHLGIVIVAIFVIAVNFFINKTKWGYKITVTGNNEEFAKSVGMNTPRIIMLAQLVGGFVAVLVVALKCLVCIRVFNGWRCWIWFRWCCFKYYC